MFETLHETLVDACMGCWGRVGLHYQRGYERKGDEWYGSNESARDSLILASALLCVFVVCSFYFISLLDHVEPTLHRLRPVCLANTTRVF